MTDEQYRQILAEIRGVKQEGSFAVVLLCMALAGIIFLVLVTLTPVHAQEIILGDAVGRSIIQPQGIAIKDDVLYACDTGTAGGGVVRKYDMVHNSYTLAASGLSLPLDVTIGPDGNPYVSEYNASRVSRIEPDGSLTNIWQATGSGPAGMIPYGPGLMIGLRNTNYVVALISFGPVATKFAGNGQWGYTGENIPALSSKLSTPNDVAQLADGSVALTQLTGSRVSLVDGAGMIRTWAGNGSQGDSGDGGPPSAAQVSQPAYIDAVGEDVYFGEYAGCRVRQIASNVISTFATGCSPTGITHDSNYLYVAWSYQQVVRYPLPNVPTPTEIAATPTHALPTATFVPTSTPLPAVSPTPTAFVLACPHTVRCKCVP